MSDFTNDFSSSTSSLVASSKSCVSESVTCASIFLPLIDICFIGVDVPTFPFLSLFVKPSLPSLVTKMSDMESKSILSPTSISMLPLPSNLFPFIVFMVIPSLSSSCLLDHSFLSFLVTWMSSLSICD